MSAHPTFGKIVLKFGATGAADEPPLRFRAGHINLIVGPNDAGKSLMLRELSGVEPRADRRRLRFPGRARQTLIVESVDWSADEARALMDEVVATVLGQDDKNRWPDIPRTDGHKLADALQVAIPRLERLRDDLGETIRTGIADSLQALAQEKLPDKVEGMQSLATEHLDKLKIDWRETTVPVIVGALGLVAIPRLITDFGAEYPKLLDHFTDDPDFVRLLDQEHVKKLLSTDQRDRIRALLDRTWEQAQIALASLGIRTNGLSVEPLLDWRTLAVVLREELAPLHMLLGVASLMSGKDIQLPDLPQLSDEQVQQFQQLRRLGGWFFNQAPLKRLQDKIGEQYARHTWLDPSCRAQMARTVLYLDGLTRLEMTRAGELKGYEQSQADAPPIIPLRKQPMVRQQLRKLVFDALGAYLVVDCVTNTPQAIWRLSSKPPPESSDLEQSLDEQANEFHKQAGLLLERSDGIHAFVGMLASVFASSSRLVFIDEPEAFLHPPLVRKLARQLATVARDSERQFFIATHSPDLLASCAAIGADVNIVRLTHGQRSTARLLDSATLRELALDPLLRSESTLSALFHQGAVVCEAAADRVLYQEVNQRLLMDETSPGDGLDSCVFLNAQNWQTVPRMIAPLRRMGVAAAAVIDADTLFEPHFTQILVAAQVGEILRKSWLQQRGWLQEKIAERLGKTQKQVKLKGETIHGLVGEEQTVLASLRDNMARYGIFLVPVGELEDWFSYLGIKPSTDKSKWLRRTLDRLGMDPHSDDYVRPTDGDIWDFMRQVNRWIGDPERLGTAPAAAMREQGDAPT